MNGKSIDGRSERLLEAIRTGRESTFNTINGDEQAIIDHAQSFRDLDSWSRGKAFTLVDQSVGWMQKQEVLRFLSLVPRDQWQQALNLVEYCGTADLSFNSGILNTILAQSREEHVPPEWIADELLSELKEEPVAKAKDTIPHRHHHENRTSPGFFINRDAVK
jgi:hypothetical protein